MKRLSVVLALAAIVATASPAFADPPPRNKNGNVLTFSCTRGSETITFRAIGVLQSAQVAGQLLDGTAVVTIVRLTASNGQVLFSVPGQLKRSDLWTCTVAEEPGATALVFLTPR